MRSVGHVGSVKDIVGVAGVAELMLMQPRVSETLFFHFMHFMIQLNGASDNASKNTGSASKYISRPPAPAAHCSM